MADAVASAGAEVSPVLSGFLTKEQFAQELRRSTRTLDRWDSLRIGPPRTYVGKTPLYRVESVREWLENQEQRNRKR